MPSKPRSVLLRNGSVHSPVAPRATAMLTMGDTVAWVGDEEAAAIHGADVVVDLDGRLVAPAFVDAHMHLAQTGQALRSLDLSQTSSLGVALDQLASFAGTTQGDWVYAFGWDETHWPERRPFTMAEVDRAVGDRLTYLSRVDVHSAVVSSAVVDRLPELRTLAGWDGSGWVTREAHHAVRDLSISSQTPAERKLAIRAALQHAAAHGIGLVHELGAPHLSRPGDREAVAALRGELALPETAMYWGQPFADCTDVAGYLGLAGDLCADGAIGSRTAALRAPYADGETLGHLYLDVESIRDHVVGCTRAGLQAGFHCIGDRSTSTVLDGFRQAAKIVGQDAMVMARHRLEHVEMLDLEGIATLAALGIVASVQPAFDAFWGGTDGLYAQRLGADRARTMNPFATLAGAGVTLAFGSDSPVTPVDPWAGVRAAAYHRTPSERLTVRAAFNAHTRGGHRAMGNDEGGVLAPGLPATYAVWRLHGDLTVQPTDPASGVPRLPDLDPDVPLPTCTRTVVNGATVFDVEDAA